MIRRTSIGAVEFEAYQQRVRENMELSVETKVAAAIAAGFMGLTAIAITQGNSEAQTSEPNGYGPTNNPRVSAYISQQGYDSALQQPQLIDAIRL